MTGAINFYPRSPCGERPAELAGRLHAYRISIHALLAESDLALAVAFGTHQAFLSTLSLRRATKAPHTGAERKTISIHALLAESDDKANFTGKAKPYFYPRSPCGERPFINCNSNFTQKFLSTLSLRRATYLSWAFLTRFKRFLSTLSLRRATQS